MRGLSLMVRKWLPSLTVIAIIAVAILAATPLPADGFSPTDYFSYTYTFSFDKTSISAGEQFFASVTGYVTCLKDLPDILGKGTAVARVAARDQASGREYELNSNFSLSFSNFPKKKGESVSDTVRVPLRFPDNSPPGMYSVTGYLLEARVTVFAIGHLDVSSYLPSSLDMGTVVYNLPGQSGAAATGGGPGAGGGSGPVASPRPPGYNDVAGKSDDKGVFREDVKAVSEFGAALVHIETGTSGKQADGSVLVKITIVPATSPPEAPPGHNLVSDVFEFGPDGITFDPPVLIKLAYDPKKLPDGMDKSTLLIAYYDGVAKIWITVETEDIQDDTITGWISHFTPFGVMSGGPLAAPAPPPSSTAPPASSTPPAPSVTATPPPPSASSPPSSTPSATSAAPSVASAAQPAATGSAPSQSLPVNTTSPSAAPSQPALTPARTAGLHPATSESPVVPPQARSGFPWELLVGMGGGILAGGLVMLVWWRIKSGHKA